jgi:hypothetical protein
LANGISARIVVPLPGEDSTAKWPPTISTRSRMPSSPKPLFLRVGRLYHNPKTTARKRPQYYGHVINKYIYEPLEEGYVKQGLDRKNITDTGKRRARFHQWLTDFGVQQLNIQLGRTLGIMEISPNLRRFKENATRQSGLNAVQLLLFEDDEL